MNKKRIMLFSYAMGAIVNLGYAAARSMPLFIAARVLHGIQFAFIGSLSMTVAADSLPKEKMASGLGLFSAAIAVSMAIAPTIGIALRSWGESTFGSLGAGYTVVFLTAAACMLISLIPCSLLPYKHRSKEELASLGAWYKNIIAREALMPSVVVLFFSMAQITYIIYMEPYAQANNIPNVGLFFTIYAFVLFAARPASGRLVDKYGIPKVLIPGSLIFALSFLVVGLGNSFPAVVAAAILAPLGFGLAQPAIQVMALQSVEPVRRGVASNTNFFGIDLGFFVGPSLAGLAYSLTGSYTTMFMLAALPVLVALLIFTVSVKTFYQKAMAKRAADRE